MFLGPSPAPDFDLAGLELRTFGVVFAGAISVPDLSTGAAGGGVVALEYLKYYQMKYAEVPITTPKTHRVTRMTATIAIHVHTVSAPPSKSLCSTEFMKYTAIPRGSEELGSWFLGNFGFDLSTGCISSSFGTDPSVILACVNLALGAIPIRPFASSNTV